MISIAGRARKLDDKFPGSAEAHGLKQQSGMAALSSNFVAEFAGLDTRALCQHLQTVDRPFEKSQACVRE